MRTIERTPNQFKRDYKRETKGRSGAYAQKLDSELGAVVQVLAVDGTLDRRYEDHPLTGQWRDHRDCHIRPDLVLIYRKPAQDMLTLLCGLGRMVSYLGVAPSARPPSLAIHPLRNCAVTPVGGGPRGITKAADRVEWLEPDRGLAAPSRVWPV